jgi:hypothetical protein
MTAAVTARCREPLGKLERRLSGVALAGVEGGRLGER